MLALLRPREPELREPIERIVVEIAALGVSGPREDAVEQHPDVRERLRSHRAGEILLASSIACLGRSLHDDVLMCAPPGNRSARAGSPSGRERERLPPADWIAVCGLNLVYSATLIGTRHAE